MFLHNNVNVCFNNLSKSFYSVNETDPKCGEPFPPHFTFEEQNGEDRLIIAAFVLALTDLNIT